MRKILIPLIVFVLSACFASAASLETNYSSALTGYQVSEGNSFLLVTQMKYEPYPVNPGEYLTLWVKAQKIGTKQADNVTFELVPKYPFSLDSNENPVRQYGRINSEPVVMEYKVRVDKDAVEGANEMDIRYKAVPGNSWDYKTLEISVANAQTDFDLVAQETNGNEVSIAIANIGKNPAYSVIVRVPEQENFQVAGTSGQMVGNLENGDYTLVGFEVARKGRNSNAPLKIQIDYTDTIGERRSLVKDVPLGNDNFSPVFSGNSSANGQAPSYARGSYAVQAQSIYQKWWLWAIVIVIAYAGFRGYKWYAEKKAHREDVERKAKR